jgi:hypothetical protein
VQFGTKMVLVRVDSLLVEAGSLLVRFFFLLLRVGKPRVYGHITHIKT